MSKKRIIIVLVLLLSICMEGAIISLVLYVDSSFWKFFVAVLIGVCALVLVVAITFILAMFLSEIFIDRLFNSRENKKKREQMEINESNLMSANEGFLESISDQLFTAESASKHKEILEKLKQTDEIVIKNMVAKTEKAISDFHNFNSVIPSLTLFITVLLAFMTIFTKNNENLLLVSGSLLIYLFIVAPFALSRSKKGKTTSKLIYLKLLLIQVLEEKEEL